MNRRKVAGVVITFEPGFSEWGFAIDTPYTCLKLINGKPELIDMSAMAKERKHYLIENTMNMLIHLGSMTKLINKNMTGVANFVEREAQKHFPELYPEAIKKVQEDAKKKEELQDARDKVLDAKEQNIRNVIYNLLLDPQADHQDLEYGQEHLEPLLTELTKDKGYGLLHGMIAALETFLKKR